MAACSVTTCTNHHRKTRNTGIKYYRFPTDPKLLELWITACGRDRQKILNLKHATICSIHFRADCIEVPLKMKLLNYQPETARLLKADSVPTLHLPYSELSEANINMDTFQATCDLQISKQIPETSYAEEKLNTLQDQNMESDIIWASTELEDPLAMDKTQTPASTEKDPLHHQTKSSSLKPDIFIPLGSESLVVPKIEEEEEVNPNEANNDFEQFGRFVTSVQRRTLSEAAAMEQKRRNASRPKSRRKICREMRKLKLLKNNGTSIDKKEVSEKNINTSTCLAISDQVKPLKTYTRISVLKLRPYNSYDQNMEDPLAIDKIQITSTTEKDPLDLQTQSSSREADIFIPLDSETLVAPKVEAEDEVNRNVPKIDFDQFGRFVACMLGKATPVRAAKLQGKIISLLLESDANS